jgi:sarcosine oxidase
MPDLQVCSPTSISRQITPGDEAAMRASVKALLPELDGSLVHATTCMYTNTLDKNFLVGFHPGFANSVILAAGFSGHGFKFCSVIGEILADLATKGTTNHDLSLFALDRFSTQ